MYPPLIQRTVQYVIHVHPFFGYLAMVLEWSWSDEIDTACTDGTWVRINRTFFLSLSDSERAFVVTHETLHAALSHIPRARILAHSSQDFIRANIACDITINGRIAQYFDAPRRAIRDKTLEHLSMEEVFRCLPEQAHFKKMSAVVGVGARDLAPAIAQQKAGLNVQGVDWPNQLRKAAILAKQCGGGHRNPLGLEREWRAALGEPEVDWVTHLNAFIVAEQTEWGGWDRRYMYQGMYLPVLSQDGVRLIVGVDTSGSISEDMLQCFLKELVGILSVAEATTVDVYFTDSKVYGPIRLTAQSDVSTLVPKGGGGTNFHPLFEIAEHILWDEGLSQLLLIYFTDGFGPAPTSTSEGLSTLWLVPEGGRIAAGFGEVVRVRTTG